MCSFMHQFAQEIAQIRKPFEKHCKYSDNNRILFERVHTTGMTYYINKCYINCALIYSAPACARLLLSSYTSGSQVFIKSPVVSRSATCLALTK